MRPNHNHSMYCQIIPNDVLMKVYEVMEDADKLKLLENMQQSIQQRYQRSVIYNNREIFIPTLLDWLQTGKERLWFYDCQSKARFPDDPDVKREEEHEADKPSLPMEIIPQIHMNNMDETYDFFRDVYGRRSFDDRSATVKFYSNYGADYSNAFWDGKEMVFGTGGQYFNDFGTIVDIVGHEFTHAVVQYTSDLDYHGQSGALNEHCADVFGSLIKQYLKHETTQQANWLIGEGIWDASLPSTFVSLRNMKDPGTGYPGDAQPNHMSNLYQGPDDNGGVHINSGIPNKAFYLAAMKVGGYAWDQTGKIWFETMKDRSMVPMDCNFAQFARTTLVKAAQLYPPHISDVAVKIQEAWQEVGVL